LATTKAFELAQLSAVVTSSSGVSSFTDALDVNGAEILVGTNNSRFAENNLRFMAAGASYIDVNTVGQALNFRVSENASLDTTAISIADDGKVTMPNLIGNTTVEHNYAGTYPSATSRVLTLKNTNTTSDSVSFGLRTTAGGTGSVAKTIDFINTDGTLVLRTSSNSTGTLAHPLELDNFQLNITPTTTSTSTTTGAIITAGGVGIAENLYVGGNTVISGDLTVEGTSVTLNTTDLSVEDKNITLNYHASNDTSASAGGSGITIQDAVDASNDASILWNATNDEFDFSHAITVPSTLTLTSNAPRIFLYEADTTDLNTALFSSGGKFTIRTTTDDDATRTTRLEVDHNNGNITFYDSAGEAGLVWDAGEGSDGVLLIGGHTDLRAGSVAGRNDAQLSLESTNYHNAIFVENQNTANGYHLVLGKTRGTAVNAVTIVQAEDEIGSLTFAAADGTDLRPKVAQISAYVSAGTTPATNAVSGELRFGTTSQAQDTTTHMVLNKDGRLGIGTLLPETMLDVQNSSTALYTSNMSGTGSYIPSSSDMIQVRNTHTGLDDIYAGIWFETGTGATNTTGTDRAGRIALVVDNDSAYSSNFVFQTRSANGQLTEKMRITQDGNVGIGRTPESHYTGYTALDLGHSSSLFGNKTGSDTNVVTLANNGYLNSTASAWKYIVTDEATKYEQSNGKHRWFQASSGTAGTNITWKNSMSIDIGGTVGIGTDNTVIPSDYELVLQNGHTSGAGNPNVPVGMMFSNYSNNTTSNGDTTGFIDFASGEDRKLNARISAIAEGSTNGSHITFKTRQGLGYVGTTTLDERLRIQGNGNVGIGVTEAKTKLHVDGAITHSLVVASEENPIRSSSDADKYFTYTPDIGLSYLTWDFTTDERIKYHCRPGYGNSGYLRVGNGTDAHILPEGWTGTVSAYMYGWSANFGSSVRMQTKPLSSGSWTERISTTDNGTGQYSQVGSWSVTTALTEPYAVRFYFSQGSGVGTTSDRCYIKNLTISNLVDSQIKVNQAIRYHNGNVGVGITYPPTAPLHVAGSADGQAFGGKAISVGSSFSGGAQLEITLGDHQACFVKVFVTGDWSGHSAVAFLGEYFVQNGANAYAEAGMIIREVDNTGGPVGDYISSRIVDGGNYDSFQIQFKTNNVSGSAVDAFAGFLNYQVMGYFDAIT
jgi:hypothetical protein